MLQNIFGTAPPAERLLTKDCLIHSLALAPPKYANVDMERNAKVAHRSVPRSSAVIAMPPPPSYGANAFPKAATIETTLDSNPRGRNSDVMIDCTIDELAHSEAIRCKKIDSGLR